MKFDSTSFGQTIEQTHSLLNFEGSTKKLPSFVDILLFPKPIQFKDWLFSGNVGENNTGANFGVLNTSHGLYSDKGLVLNNSKDGGIPKAFTYAVTHTEKAAESLFANMRDYVDQLIIEGDVTLFSVDSTNADFNEGDGDFLKNSTSGGYGVYSAIDELLNAFNQSFYLLGDKNKATKETYYQCLGESLIKTLRFGKCKTVSSFFSYTLGAGQILSVTKSCLTYLETDEERVLFTQMMMGVVSERKSSRFLGEAIALLMTLPSEVVVKALSSLHPTGEAKDGFQPTSFHTLVNHIGPSSAPILMIVINSVIKSTPLSQIGDWMYRSPNIYAFIYMTGRMLSFVQYLNKEEIDTLRLVMLAHYTQFDLHAKKEYISTPLSVQASAFSALGIGLKCIEPLPDAFLNAEFFGIQLYKRVKRYVRSTAIKNNNFMVVESLREINQFDYSNPKEHQGIEYYRTSYGADPIDNKRGADFWMRTKEWALADHTDVSGNIDYKKFAKTICHAHESIFLLLKSLSVDGKLNRIEMCQYVTTQRGYTAMRNAWNIPPSVFLDKTNSRHIKVMAMKDILE